MKKILILDDEQELLNIWFFHFKMWNIPVEIHTAKNGVEGLRLLQAVDDYDLIITDYKMPKMDGIEFIQKLHEDKTRRNLPIFFFTGYSPEVLQKIGNIDQVMVFDKPMITEKIYLYIKLSLKLIPNNKTE